MVRSLGDTATTWSDVRHCCIRCNYAWIAQRRIAAGAAREVHAWVIGTLGDVRLATPTRLTYRPHERAVFFRLDTGAAVWTAPAVLFTDAAWIEAA